MTQLSNPYPEYQDDIVLCKSIHRAYGKNFYAGTVFFPKALREATHALYAFVRIPDEYVDTVNPTQKDKGLEQVMHWQEAWKTCYESDKAHTETSLNITTDELRVLRATKYIFKKYEIPFACSTDFLSAMIQDTSVERYETYADLEKYMYGSASVVGVMMTYIMCHHDVRFTTDQEYRIKILSYAKTLGDAFQMTNFIRDIGEDYDERRRIYIPQEDMRKYQVIESMIAGKKITPEFQALIKAEIMRTEKLYTEADRGIALLPAFAGRGIYVARILYSALHGVILARHCDTLRGRARLSRIKKYMLVFFVLIRYPLFIRHMRNRV